MALTYNQIYTTVTQGNSARPQVYVAVAIAAVAVLSEDPATANHAARLAWAQKALANTSYMAEAMTIGLLSDPNIQAAMPTPTDAQIQASVNSLVNGYLNA